jgi:hypothetical protein
MRKLFLDDVREPWDDTWDIVRDFEAFKRYIKKYGIPEVIAFDHDLGEQHYQAYAKGASNEIYEPGTGYDCAVWLVIHAVENGQTLPTIVIVHSWNSDGAKRIQELFQTVSATLKFPYPCSPIKTFIEKI